MNSNSSNISLMRAFFLPPITRQMRSAIAIALLLCSLLGSHWIGFAHGISHAGLMAQNVEQDEGNAKVSLQIKQVKHSNASCQLLDALTLASFIGSTAIISLHSPILNELLISTNSGVLPSYAATPYQSRAPPFFII